MTTTRPRIYLKQFVVPADAMDRQGHVNNLAYVAWMQDVAIEHSAAAGWPMERYLTLGAGWVVRSHFVEYLRPVVAGQRMAIYTWVPEFTQRSTPRRYFFVREDDRQLVARAETRWVFVDLATGRRRSLPDDLLAAFESVPDETEVRRLAGVEPLHSGSAMDLTPRVLEGPNVRLEPLTPESLDGLCEAGLDPELWKLTVSRIRTRADMQRYLEEALTDQRAGSALPFATVWRATGRVIGSTRFGNASPPNRRVEIGWTWLARPWQRTGANTEAKYLMLRHAFEQWGCIRVELKTSALNSRSRAAILRIGAQEEGILRHHMINEDGSLRDSVFFSLLAEEWPEARRRLEGMLAAYGVQVAEVG